MSRPKIVIRVKKIPLYDEYVLTNKHIICKFKYLVECFDHQETDQSEGLVCLQTDRLSELITEQNITFDSLTTDGYLSNILKQLHAWHPSIIKVDVDTENLVGVADLSEYPVTWENYQEYITSFKYNRCVTTDDDFRRFKQSKHNVVNINVYFRLTKRIEKISEYGVNFKYLRKLLTQSLIQLNNDNTLFLDEVTVNANQLPFSSSLNEEEEIYYVYPYIALLPLYPVFT